MIFPSIFRVSFYVSKSPCRRFLTTIVTSLETFAVLSLENITSERHHLQINPSTTGNFVGSTSFNFPLSSGQVSLDSRDEIWYLIRQTTNALYLYATKRFPEKTFSGNCALKRFTKAKVNRFNKGEVPGARFDFFFAAWWTGNTQKRVVMESLSINNP